MNPLKPGPLPVRHTLCAAAEGPPTKKTHRNPIPGPARQASTFPMKDEGPADVR